jgi:hypothetical protein
MVGLFLFYEGGIKRLQQPCTSDVREVQMAVSTGRQKNKLIYGEEFAIFRKKYTFALHYAGN